MKQMTKEMRFLISDYQSVLDKIETSYVSKSIDNMANNIFSSCDLFYFIIGL